jgi:Holliday junction resolvasome RuvABC endonuclease subunit
MVKLLCLDVSSSCLGWALGEINTAPAGAVGDLIDLGRFAPPASRTSLERIRMICKEVEGLIFQLRPDRALMEWQSHKTRRLRAQGLAVLGQAQGAVLVTLERELASVDLVDVVSERDWTGGKPKDQRATITSLRSTLLGLFLSKGHDPGLDAADAAGIFFWKLDQVFVESRRSCLVKMGASHGRK